MLQAACCAIDAGSEGVAEGGGGREAALDRAVLLCEAFAQLGAAPAPRACQDDLEARLVGEHNVRAAERAAPQADASHADAPDADADGGTVGALRAWLTSHQEAAEQALAEAERVEGARSERATRLGGGGGGGGGGGVRLEVFPNPALSSLAAGCATLLGHP